jgi:UDP-N-acetylglucosamine 4,6-dehydratase (inverting)
MLDGKSILITGGTGSFGKKFVETVLKLHPEIERVVIYSRDEFKQFNMQNMPVFRDHLAKMRFFVGDVRDKERLYRAMSGIDFVVHAAALKQVPSCEYNPFEAIKTNVLGAANVIDACIDRGVKKVVALSTDKACAPVNLYGATKLCSDKLFICGNNYSGPNGTKFSVVRYGNVAGSRGSVIPYFQELIRSGARELPITDLNMTRFWLKLEQAVEMVLDALTSMHGGELFVKKIPSMRMTDLAYAIDKNAKLIEVGIRPGEKLHEQMISQADARSTIDVGGYYIILPQMERRDISDYYKDAKHVPENFEYSSKLNDRWLSIDEMKQLIAGL